MFAIRCSEIFSHLLAESWHTDICDLWLPAATVPCLAIMGYFGVSPDAPECLGCFGLLFPSCCPVVAFVADGGRRQTCPCFSLKIGKAGYPPLPPSPTLRGLSGLQVSYFFMRKKAQFFQSCQYFCQRGNSQSKPHTRNGLCSVVVIQGAVIVALMCSYVLLSFSCIADFLQEITFKPKSWGMHHMGFTSINSPRPSELRITWEPKSSSSKPSSKAVICPRQS